jgi:hypothetical protein
MLTGEPAREDVTGEVCVSVAPSVAEVDLHEPECDSGNTDWVHLAWIMATSGDPVKVTKHIHIRKRQTFLTVRNSPQLN